MKELDALNGAMVVAMISMRVMEVAIDEIIDMVAVRNRGVAAVRAVNMARLMAATAMVRRTRGRIRPADR